MTHRNNPSFYLNENVAVQVSSELFSLGIKAYHTVIIGNRQFSDEQQLEYAAKNGHILVTHNRRHFLRLHRNWLEEGKKHSGIILLHMADSEIIIAKLKKFIDLIYPLTDDSFCLRPKDITL